MKLKFKSLPFWIFLQIILQLYAGSCICATLNKVGQTRKNNNYANGHETNKGIKLYMQYLEETFGHDPFVYSWFTSEDSDHQINYDKVIVEKLIRDSFQKSNRSNLNNEAMEAFLTGNLVSSNKLRESRILEVDKFQHENVCNNSSVSVSTIDSDYLQPEIPAGCRFYAGDTTYKYYLICDDPELSEIPQLPNFLDIFQMNTTNVRCIRSHDFNNVQVQFIRLNENKIQDVSSDSFSNIRGLKHLSMNQNKLRVPIWFTSYAGLEQLQLLELQHNQISMDKLQRLENGDVYERLRTEIENGPVLTSIKYMSLMSNPIGFIPSWFFARFNGTEWPLLTIKLSGCRLYHISEDAFIHFKKLYLLELNENPDLMANLTTVAIGLARVNIQKLALAYNSLTQVPKDALEKMKDSLAGLDLRGNSFHQLADDAFPLMQKLASLNLEYCKLSSISRSAFNNLYNLDTLSLKGNGLTSLPGALGALVNLNTLVLSANNDDRVNQFVITPKGFENLRNLKSLFMNELKLTNLSRNAFEGLTKLKLLHVTKSKLSTIEDGTFVHTLNLEYLDMSETPSLKINSNTFRGLKKLNSLYLQKCNLNLPRNPFKHLDKLKYLFLSKNKVNNLHPKLFANMPYLHYLDLNHNNIQPWTNSIFNNNPILQEFYLSSNNIETITEGMFQDFVEVYTNIDLTENPFVCDIGVCNLKTLVSNSTFTLNNWKSAPSRYQCVMDGQEQVQINSLTDEYCSKLESVLKFK